MRRNQHIVVAEDDRLVRTIYARALAEYLSDFDLHIVADGQDALNLGKLLDPLIIVTDINMPILGGLDLFRQLNDHCVAHDKSMPAFIFVSGVQVAIEGLDKDCLLWPNQTLVKPFKPIELRRTLNTVLKAIEQN